MTQDAAAVQKVFLKNVRGAEGREMKAARKALQEWKISEM